MGDMMQAAMRRPAAAAGAAPGFVAREPRYGCRIPARLRLAQGEVGCVVINLSQGGAAIEVDAVIGLGAGQRLCLASGLLGELCGAVRWKSGVRHGIQFDDAARQSRPLAACLAELAEGAPRP